MKVWFVGEDASVAMGCGEYPQCSGPYRRLEDALSTAKRWRGEGVVVVYEATATRKVVIEIKRVATESEA